MMATAESESYFRDLGFRSTCENGRDTLLFYYDSNVVTAALYVIVETGREL